MNRIVIPLILLTAVIAGLPAAPLPPQEPEILIPAPIGNGAEDPMIPAPGMGWVAFCLNSNIFNEYAADLNLLRRELEALRPPASGPAAAWPDHCRIIYVRLSWREFAEYRDTALTAFMEAIREFNRRQTDPYRTIHVIFSLMFADTCNAELADYPPGGEIDRFPPYNPEGCRCPDCAGAAGIMDTYLLDYCADTNWAPCRDQAGNPPYFARYQIRELNYFNPAVLPAVLAGWNQAQADFMARYDFINGTDAAFLGDWGQNHLLMFIRYGQSGPPLDWETFRNNLEEWLTDFRSRMQALPRQVDIFFNDNYNWQWVEERSRQSGLIRPEQSLVADMFGLAEELGFSIHSGDSPARLPYDAAYAVAYRETVRHTAPSFFEWIENDSLEDEFSYYPNYMQLNMCGLGGIWTGCWGLGEAARAFGDSNFLPWKNRLGYRLQIRTIRRELEGVPARLFIRIANTGDGYCNRPVRLTLFCGGPASLPPVIEEIGAEEIRRLRREDRDEMEIMFTLPFAVQGDPSAAEAGVWKLGLEVFDSWTGQYLPVAWANGEGGIPANPLTVIARRGDVDGDGEVTLRDLQTLYRYVAGEAGRSGWDPRRQDLNGDGVTDTRDLLILHFLIGEVEGTSS